MAREKSPLPGWDPYVQRYWRDVHHRLITYTSDQLRRQLPEELRARIEERVVLEAGDWEDSQAYLPDVSVIEWPRGKTNGGALAVEDAVAEPLTIRRLPEPLTESYIEIRDVSSGGRLVTTIEFTSPSNKTAGRGADGFRQKQKDFRKAKVNLVEIDLIRGGEHIIAIPLDELSEEQRQPPFICVTEGWRREAYLFYPISIREPLPAIHIPLRRTDKPARLDLQSVFNLAYLNGDYGSDIDYSQDPKIPLSRPETDWLHQRLSAEGLRK